MERGGTPDARLRFVSVSRIAGADPSEGGCLRSWFYEMVLGKKKPKTRASMRGDDLHARVECYLKTGDRSQLNTLALRGLHFVQDPVKYKDGVPDMLVEQDMLQRPGEPWPGDGLDLTKPDQLAVAEVRAAEALARAPLKLDGVPLLGRMDLVHGRGVNKGATEVGDTVDPPGTVEVCDWKSTGSPDYIKRPSDLPKLAQMAGYGSWVYAVEPAADKVRLSHGYFVEQGGPSRKVSLLVTKDDIRPAWEHSGEVVRSMKRAAAEPDVDRVDANLGACERYGGCPHKPYCKAGMHKALASFIGQTAADNVLKKRKENEDMGLLDKMKAAGGHAGPPALAPAVATPAPAPPKEASVAIGLGGFLGSAAPTPAPATPPGPTPEQVAAEKAKIEAEEKMQREMAQLRQLADRIAPTLKVIAEYAAANPADVLGTPGLGPTLATAASLLAGTKVEHGTSIPGTGKLAGLVLNTVEDLEQMPKQLDAAAAAGQIKAPAGASPLAGMPAPAAAQPTNSQAPSAPQTTPPAAPAAGEDSKPEKTKAKPKEQKPKPPSGTAFNLVVDAECAGLGTLENIRPIITAVEEALRAATNDPDLLAAGVRDDGSGKLVVEPNATLGFGRWDGALRAALREQEIAPGSYYLSTRGDRVAEVAAAELSARCAKTGGFFVWGRR